MVLLIDVFRYHLPVSADAASAAAADGAPKPPPPEAARLAIEELCSTVLRACGQARDVERISTLLSLMRQHNMFTARLCERTFHVSEAHRSPPPSLPLPLTLFPTHVFGCVCGCVQVYGSLQALGEAYDLWEWVRVHSDEMPITPLMWHAAIDCFARCVDLRMALTLMMQYQKSAVFRAVVLPALAAVASTPMPTAPTAIDSPDATSPAALLAFNAHLQHTLQVISNTTLLYPSVQILLEREQRSLAKLAERTALAMAEYSAVARASAARAFAGQQRLEEQKAVEDRKRLEESGITEEELLFVEHRQAILPPPPPPDTIAMEPAQMVLAAGEQGGAAAAVTAAPTTATTAGSATKPPRASAAASATSTSGVGGIASFVSSKPLSAANRLLSATSSSSADAKQRAAELDAELGAAAAVSAEEEQAECALRSRWAREDEAALSKQAAEGEEKEEEWEVAARRDMLKAQADAERDAEAADAEEEAAAPYAEAAGDEPQEFEALRLYDDGIHSPAVMSAAAASRAAAHAAATSSTASKFPHAFPASFVNSLPGFERLSSELFDIRRRRLLNTYRWLLHACRRAGAPHLALGVWEEMSRYALPPDSFHYRALLDCFRPVRGAQRAVDGESQARARWHVFWEGRFEALTKLEQELKTKRLQAKERQMAASAAAQFATAVPSTAGSATTLSTASSSSQPLDTITSASSTHSAAAASNSLTPVSAAPPALPPAHLSDGFFDTLFDSPSTSAAAAAAVAADAPASADSSVSSAELATLHTRSLDLLTPLSPVSWIALYRPLWSQKPSFLPARVAERYDVFRKLNVPALGPLLPGGIRSPEAGGGFKHVVDTNERSGEWSAPITLVVLQHWIKSGELVVGGIVC